MTTIQAIRRRYTRRNYTFTGKPPAAVIDALVRLGYEYDERAQQWWKQDAESGVTDEPQLIAALHAEEAAFTGGTLTRDEHQRRYQSYYTPEALARELGELAGVKEGMDCLEPSAGSGVIAHAIVAAGGTVTLVEADPDACANLCGSFGDVHGDDFLATDGTPGGLGTFDRIVMNPPFSRDQDARHVCHAWAFLKPGGKLVAVVGQYALNGKTGDRIRFGDLVSRYGRVVRELPPGTFENNARAVIVELVNPGVALKLAA